MIGADVSQSEDSEDTVSGVERVSSVAESVPTNVLLVSGVVDPDRTLTELRLEGGQILQLSTAMLLRTQKPEVHRNDGEPEESAGRALVVPVIEEQLQVGKRTVVTGTVRLEKQVQEYHEVLDVPLAVRTYDIERVVLNQSVEEAPPVRQEGDTTIYPLVEERLLITKQLILKEELRVTRRDTERHDTRTVTLKREKMLVTRTPRSDA